MTKVTGWDNGLSQDYDKGLGRWFANRLGARQQLSQDFEMTQVLIDRKRMAQQGELRTCENCAVNDKSEHPKCMMCCGPHSEQTRFIQIVRPPCKHRWWGFADAPSTCLDCGAEEVE